MRKERVEVKVKKKITLRLTEQEALALQAFYDMSSRMVRERLPDGDKLLDSVRQQTVDELFNDLETKLRPTW
jgi:hypothetical protein